MIHPSCFPPLLTPLSFWISTCLCLGHFSWLSPSCALGRSNTSSLVLGIFPSGVSGMCCPLALLQLGERLWLPFGVMRTKAGIKKIKDTEGEPLCSPVKGHELNLLRRWPSPSPAHHLVAGMPLRLGFAERGDVAVPKLLLKPRGV